MALARELYFKANRDLIAKALAELYYEEVLPARQQGEHFELALEGEAAARGVIVRAADALNNVASARGEAPAGAPAGSGRR